MRRFARLGALVATTALTVSGLAAATAPSADALLTPNPQAANAAASWLANQLTTDGQFGGTCSFDCGNDIDAGLSLLDIGGHSSTVTNMKAHLPDNVLGYITGEAFQDTGSTYAGPTAKSLVFATATGLDPTSYGADNVNLVTRLEAQVTSGGVNDGRIVDTSTFGDNANTLGQAFAARGLDAVSSTDAAAVQTFLLKQQCASGYFRQDFSAPAAANQNCSAADAPSIDATATAVIQLAAITSPPSAAINKAKAWLARVQNCDGSFGSGSLGENANSTGLAATALGASVASQEAARWLNRHQAPAGVAPLSGDIGALALNDADFNAGRSAGITTAARGRWQRATAQAAPGLASFSSDAAPLIHISVVTGYHKAGSRVGFRVTGADAGTVVCLGTSRALTNAAGANLVTRLPAGTASRLFLARDGYGDAAGSIVRVLGATSLSVTKSKARVKRHKYVSVTVSGLQPGEQARITFRGVVKATGLADSAGRFSHAFKVGTKKGKGVVGGYGQFTDIRKGATTIKVVK